MKELKVDKEFKTLIPPLSNEEYKQLEENIKKDGCRDAIITWNNIIIDGHNRYEICQRNNLPYKTSEIKFSDREEAIEWMLMNQLGRRNLNDFQRNEVALKFQEVIAKQMKKRMSDGGGDKVSQDARAGMFKRTTPVERTSSRKEMAKIAGTSEISIHRTKQILEKGTPEQIDRARKGGPGNTVCGIHKEITGKSYPLKKEPESTEEVVQQSKSKPIVETKVCKSCQKELPIYNFYEGKNTCKNCSAANQKYTDFLGRPLKEMTPEIRRLTKEEIIGDLYNIDKDVIHTIDDAISDFTCNFETFLNTLDGILEDYIELLKDQENNKKMMTVLSQAETAMSKLKGKYLYERL